MLATDGSAPADSQSPQLEQVTVEQPGQSPPQPVTGSEEIREVVTDPKLAGKPKRRDVIKGYLKSKLVWERIVYVLVTCVYYLYRSRGSPTFTHHPFKVKLNDLWGVLFVAMFAITRRGSYLVYAINPFRNLILVALQKLVPGLEEYAVAPEFHRDVISSCLQLSCALFVAYVITPQPIGVETEFQKPCPYASDWMHMVMHRALTVAFIGSSMAMIVMGLRDHTDEYTVFLSDHHGWKIVLAVLLGTAEEVTWREAYLEDNNNFLQAFTWGMNHLVVGEGMDNPFVYGAVSFAYAFVLGLCQFKVVRYLNHACIEYLIMDNLVKPYLV